MLRTHFQSRNDDQTGAACPIGERIQDDCPIQTKQATSMYTRAICLAETLHRRSGLSEISKVTDLSADETAQHFSTITTTTTKKDSAHKA